MPVVRSVCGVCRASPVRARVYVLYRVSNLVFYAQSANLYRDNTDFPNKTKTRPEIFIDN